VWDEYRLGLSAVVKNTDFNFTSGSHKNPSIKID